MGNKKGWCLHTVGTKNETILYESIKMADVLYFKDHTSVGDVIFCGLKGKHRRVKEKHPHICVTDKGIFNWIDMYQYSQGKVPCAVIYDYVPVNDVRADKGII